MKQLIILATLLITILSHSAGAEDFNVLWEIDFSPHASYVLVSDDGKYFYYCDEGYVKFHDSETGNLINQIPDRNKNGYNEINFQGWDSSEFGSQTEGFNWRYATNESTQNAPGFPNQNVYRVVEEIKRRVDKSKS